jgi:hypothetical protein
MLSPTSGKDRESQRANLSKKLIESPEALAGRETTGTVREPNVPELLLPEKHAIRYRAPNGFFKVMMTELDSESVWEDHQGERRAN